MPTARVPATTISNTSITAASGDPGLEAIQSRLMGNESAMAIILGLQNSPDMQAILSDPEVMSAVQRLDFEVLKNNPKIQRLINNAEVKKLL